MKLYAIRSKKTGNLFHKGHRGALVDKGVNRWDWATSALAVYAELTGPVKGLATKHGAEVVELEVSIIAPPAVPG